ncbi:anthrax toxin-like adenylyl cyclase domain-containing protein [Pseudoalteromonas luteoviolacea]|nr:anthrax toxin-like adenylyl cyclase domain-containing protein [Pseudoalteromonas luteoviolacea]KZN33704.1 hypothetical protein N483_26055 [Pseudoalteromonas luteoviolacea NCIMB 1944]
MNKQVLQSKESRTNGQNKKSQTLPQHTFGTAERFQNGFITNQGLYGVMLGERSAAPTPTQIQKRPLPIRQKVTGSIMSNESFIENYTLMPGIKYSKIAQEFKLTKHRQYRQFKAEYKTYYLNTKKNFENAFMKDNSGKERAKNPPTNKNSNIDPKSALEQLDVMQPKSQEEATLIRELDKINTRLNNGIASSMPSKQLDSRAHKSAMEVEDKGGIVGQHAMAFSQMLEKRQAGPVLIRPAGKHATKYLKESYPAKPLWVKGKSIDTSKLSEKHIKYLNTVLEHQGIPTTDAGLLSNKLKQGFIPVDQIYSKWLRSIDQKKLDALNTPAEIATSILNEVEKANRAITEMIKTGLVESSEEDDMKYVSDPATKKAYTGDYDLYSISHAKSDIGKVNEINRLRGDARSKGKYNLKDDLNSIKNAYIPYADRTPDAPKVHKLFGNISRFEMGMKIDLNSAAIKWGGYKGGQVIKHGAEARNFQYPQDINDGIVRIEQADSGFNEKAIDDKNKRFYNSFLIRKHHDLSGKNINLPLNRELTKHML